VPTRSVRRTSGFVQVVKGLRIPRQMDVSILRRFGGRIVFGPSKAEKDCYEKPAYGALARGGR